ncbi:flagellar motor protein MotB [Bdellovibrio sp. HCB337]|uniref:OmpA/MotB family protein n=1 Tax=Bdellovibrio sp. HCB337 TaxID=3394358 RepID=UPI0039A74999
MSEPRKTRKKIRVDRYDHGNSHVHDDAHSWAVSYADFLMVLLSFFIIFFSVDGNQRADVIDRIAMSATAGKGGSNALGKQKTNLQGPRLPAGIADVATGVDGFFVERADHSQKLYIYFDDNIYNPGEIDLPAAQVVRLRGILSKLEPYIKDVNITFVGHTDSTRVQRVKSKYLDNNFDLSSIRATKALQQAVKSGFDPAKMFAKGVAEHSKGTRTLSLVITPGEEER